MAEEKKEENGKNKAAKSSKPDNRVVALFVACVFVFMLLFSVETVKNAVSWFLNVMSPVIIGVAMAFIINPFCVFMRKRFTKLFAKGKLKAKTQAKAANGLSIALSVFLIIAVIAALLFLIIPEFLENLKILIDRIPSLITNVSSWIDDQLNSDSDFLHNFGTYVDSIIAHLNSWFSTELNDTVESVLSFATNSVITVLSFLFDFLVAIVVCVYALLEKNKFIAQFKKLTFALFSGERANDVLDTARYGNDIFAKFVAGKIVTSSIVGIVCFLFMTVMGIPYALLASVIVGITNVIPFFGPFIGGVPTAFIILITDVKQGIIYIVFLFVLQQIEGNIIEPKIMEDKTGVSKFWVTFSLLIFGGLFGILGMIIAVPLFAVLFYIAKLFVDRRLVKKKLPVSSDEYISVGSVNCETNELLPNPEKVHIKTQTKLEKKIISFFKKKDGE